MFSQDDFPKNFVDMQHPKDLHLSSNETKQQVYLYKSGRQESKLLLRVSFPVNSQFVPVTFVVDTGAPSTIYLGEKVWTFIHFTLESHLLGLI